MRISKWMRGFQCERDTYMYLLWTETFYLTTQSSSSQKKKNKNFLFLNILMKSFSESEDYSGASPAFIVWGALAHKQRHVGPH